MLFVIIKHKFYRELLSYAKVFISINGFILLFVLPNYLILIAAGKQSTRLPLTSRI